MLLRGVLRLHLQLVLVPGQVYGFVMFVFHLFSFFSDYVAALFYAAFAGSQSPLGVHRWLRAELVVLL